jgi:5-methylcytosine-specific restriction endonuclease McrA
MIAFDIDIQYVGVLCKRGHDYNSTGKSLRYRANNTCVVCAAGHSRKHSKTDKAKARQKAYRTTEKRKVYIMKYNQSEKGKATRKAYAKSDKYQKYRQSEEFKANQREYDKMRSSNSDIKKRRRISLKAYQQTDAFKKSVDKYCQSSKGKLRTKRGNYKRRNRINTNRVYYITDEIKNRFNCFGNRCAYCGGEYQSIDHVVPLSKGGHDAIYNLVPACNHCNFSKNNSVLRDWYFEQDFYDDERMKLIVRMVDGMNG